MSLAGKDAEFWKQKSKDLEEQRDKDRKDCAKRESLLKNKISGLRKAAAEQNNARDLKEKAFAEAILDYNAKNNDAMAHMFRELGLPLNTEFLCKDEKAKVKQVKKEKVLSCDGQWRQPEVFIFQPNFTRLEKIRLFIRKELGISKISRDDIYKRTDGLIKSGFIGEDEKFYSYLAYINDKNDFAVDYWLSLEITLDSKRKFRELWFKMISISRLSDDLISLHKFSRRHAWPHEQIATR